MTSKINLAPKNLVGIQAKGPSSFNEVEQSGSKFSEQLWREFIGKLVESGISLDRDMYGVSWPADDLTPPQYVHYFCGFVSDADLAGLTSLKLEGGNYFQYNCEVLAVDIDKGFQEAYMNAMPNSGLKGRQGQHLEIYGEEYDPESPIARFRILIPVE
jgi:predicted transcriptional regulator YdeE